MPTCRSKDIPSMEDMADCWQPKLGAIEVDKLCIQVFFFSLFQQKGQKAIVRSDKLLLTNAGGDWAAGCAYPRIDHHNMHSIRGKRRGRARQNQGCLGDILRGDLVAEVGNVGARGNSPDHTFPHTDIPILETKISGQRDNTHICLPIEKAVERG